LFSSVTIFFFRTGYTIQNSEFYDSDSSVNDEESQQTTQQFSNSIICPPYRIPPPFMMTQVHKSSSSEKNAFLCFDNFKGIAIRSGSHFQQIRRREANITIAIKNLEEITNASNLVVFGLRKNEPHLSF
jgi:hypothetical protein